LLAGSYGAVFTNDMLGFVGLSHNTSVAVSSTAADVFATLLLDGQWRCASCEQVCTCGCCGGLGILFAALCVGIVLQPFTSGYFAVFCLDRCVLTSAQMFQKVLSGSTAVSSSWLPRRCSKVERGVWRTISRCLGGNWPVVGLCRPALDDHSQQSVGLVGGRARQLRSRECLPRWCLWWQSQVYDCTLQHSLFKTRPCVLAVHFCLSTAVYFCLPTAVKFCRPPAVTHAKPQEGDSARTSSSLKY
jgi:hypothetical protein